MLAAYSWVEIALIFLVGIVIAVPFGRYMAKVYMGRPSLLDPIFSPIERLIFRALGVDPREETGWKQYALDLIIVNVIAIAFVFVLLWDQNSLPWGPLVPPGYTLPVQTWDLSLHTAVSFNTNTDYQHYSGETQMGMLASMAGLQMLMFLAPAVGLAAVVAFIRGFSRRDGKIGNFYVDLVKSITRVLLPVAFVTALILVLLGVPQTLAASTTISPFGVSAGGLFQGHETIPLGPIASWDGIEMLGSNGGGFYGANAGNPLESPSASTNLVLIVLMLLLPYAAPIMFGDMIRKPREAYPLMATILGIFVVALVLYLYFMNSNPALSGLNISQTDGYSVGANSQLTYPETALFNVVSIYGNVGAITGALGSATPGAQMVLLWGMFLQSTPGAVGVGFGLLLVNALLAVFVGGLMVGRTPEYLGKKLGREQMRWAAITLLSHPFAILLPLAAAVALGIPQAAAGPGSTGFTIVLYEFTSESANNGSGMGYFGTGDNTIFFNVVGTVIMGISRYLPMIAMLAIGGTLATQEPVAPSSGTLKTESTTFTLYFALFLLIVTGLLFLPVLALGPFSQILP